MYKKAVYKHIINELNSTNTKYKQLIIQKKKQIAQMTQQGILIRKRDGKPYYYLRSSDKDTNGKYLPPTPANQKLVRKIAQRDYDAKVLKAAEKQQRLLEKFLQKFNPDSIDDIYQNLSKARKQLIVPVYKSNEDFIREWLAIEYQKGSYDSNKTFFNTMRGEIVRSKSELLIANALFIRKIPYHYEKPLTLSNGRTIRPDFTILDIVTGKEIYWEHFGLMDDYNYRYTMLQKIEAFEKEGLTKQGRTIFTYEMTSMPLTSQTIDSIIRVRFAC